MLVISKEVEEKLAKDKDVIGIKSRIELFSLLLIYQLQLYQAVHQRELKILVKKKNCFRSYNKSYDFRTMDFNCKIQEVDLDVRCGYAY